MPAADAARWSAFSGQSTQTFARLEGFWTPTRNRNGHTDLEWEGPGSTMPFEMRVEVTSGDPSRVKAEVWTNANHNDDPGHFEAVPMHPVSFDGRFATFRLDLPIEKVGNYRAVGRISTDGGQTHTWMSSAGIPDIKFRPRDERHEGLNFMEVSVGNVNFDEATRTPGTFADLMGPGSPETNGKYTLEYLKEQGKTAIWLMPPFEVTKWDGRPPEDDAGSPYAVSDFFSIRPELSQAARGLTGEAAQQAALEEFKQFMARAEELGIQVMLDLPVNHVGHHYKFRDLFLSTDAAGHEIREVRTDDYSQVALDPRQLDVIKKRLDSPNVPNFMDYVAPWMYGSRTGSPRGAESFYDEAPGAWFEWHDTKQLNHGRRRISQYEWVEGKKSDEEQAVIGWLGRIMRFWAVDMGVDGFRLDHLAGLPSEILEVAANLAQADVDKHRPGDTLFLLGEDFHNRAETLSWVDAGQAWYFHDFLNARTPGDWEGVLANPEFHDLMAVGNHDEPRVLERLGGDVSAYLRLTTLLQLLGGPTSELAGDHYGAMERLPFKQYRGVAALRSIDADDRRLNDRFQKVGLARRDNPALQDDNRAFLRPVYGSADDALLAMSRLPDDAADPAVLVFANLSNRDTRSNAFALDDALRARIDPDKRYVVKDLVSDDSGRSLWEPPLSGRELLERGVYARLAPYQVQVLRLEEA